MMNLGITGDPLPLPEAHEHRKPKHRLELKKQAFLEGLTITGGELLELAAYAGVKVHPRTAGVRGRANPFLIVTTL